MIEAETTLAWRAYASTQSAHPDEAILGMHGWPSLRARGTICSTLTTTREVEGSVVGIVGTCCGGIRISWYLHCHIAWRLLLLSLCTSCSLGILLSQDTDDASSDFVMYDRSVVFANDINTKFLGFQSTMRQRHARGRTYDNIIRPEVAWF